MRMGGSAERAGLRGITNDGRIGDIITSADGQPVGDMDDVYRVLDKKQIGDTVNLEVYRDGRSMNVPVKLLPTPTTRSSTRRSF